jgi:hypothetical protein
LDAPRTRRSSLRDAGLVTGGTALGLAGAEEALPNRPNAATGIRNLILAEDYVRNGDWEISKIDEGRYARGQPNLLELEPLV